MSTAGHDIDLSAPPFHLPSREPADRVRATTDVEFRPRGSVVLEAGQSSAAAYVIMKGHVTAFDTDASGVRKVFAEFGPGDLFGTTATMTGQARYTYETLEDTLMWAIPAETFRACVESNGRFATYFLASLSRKTMLLDSSAPASDIGELMLTQVGQAGLSPAIIVRSDATIADATRRMRESAVDCIFVDGAHGPGIATRTDLLEALALEQHALTDRVDAIANRPVIGVDTLQPLYQALVTMTRNGIERVAVFDEKGSLAGTLGMAEVLSHYSSHSHVIGLRVARSETLEDLAEAARGLTPLVKTLNATGARMVYLTELVSALNTRIMSRLFRMCFDEEVRRHVCLLVLGSEGRGEQILKTDQDNALVTDGTIADADLEAPARAFSDGLAHLGYPPCPGGVMISNAEWRGSVDAWVARISALADDLTPAGQIRAAIILDADPIAGARELFGPLREAIRRLGRNELWLHHFIAPAIEFHTPLTLFGGLPGRDSAVDIKKGGIFPVVHGLRVMALEEEITETNSFERAARLHERGALSEGLSRDLQQALAVMLRLRLAQQIDAVREGVVPDNRIRVSALRRLDRDLLRDALRVVKEFQAFLGARYRRGI